MRLFTFAALFLLSATAALQADTPTIKIASTNYEPFTGADLPGGGIVNQIIRQIAKRAGFDIEIDYLPWARAIEATRQGIYDASSYGYHNPEREAEFFQVGPFINERITFFVRRDSTLSDWERLEDLAGLRIGVVLGYTYTNEFWDLGQAGILNLSEAHSDEANLRKLLAGRIDVFPISHDAGWHMIRQIFSEEEQARLRELEKPLTTTGSFLLVARAKPGADVIAKALQDEIDSGRALQGE